ncbi:MAG: ribonuclease P protein component [Acutalibacteraceae bacterium]
MIDLQNYVSLKQNKDFLRLYYRGKSCAKPSLVVYAGKNRLGVLRVGITTSKKIGNAVERNRSRRVIRAAWQSVLKENNLNGSWDFVFVARTKTKFQKSTQIEKAMTEALRQIGALK